MTGVGHEDSSLAAQCLAICQTLTNQGKAFSMSISVGPNFSFSWNTKSMEALPSRAKKKASPSTLRRNKRRREEFLKKKSTSLEIVDSDKDASQIVTFSCDECEHVSKTDKGLKIHKGKTHKSVENLRRSSTDHPLKVSPIKEVARLQPCNNCGENMSSSHVCHSDHEAEEVMQEQAKSPVSISPEQRALFGQMFSLYSNFYTSSDNKVT